MPFKQINHLNKVINTQLQSTYQNKNLHIFFKGNK